MNMITKAEIFHILKPMKEKLKICGICKISSMRKTELINKFICFFGDGSLLSLKKAELLNYCAQS